MKTKLILAIALLATVAFGQTALTQTTLSADITSNQNTFAVASATGIACSVTQLQPLYILDPGQQRGELVNCQAVSGTTITVQRGGAFRAAHKSGALVIISNSNNFAQSFRQFDPVGTCTGANTLFTPWINTSNGNQWLCSSVTGTWVPGFNNAMAPVEPTVAVASAAGLITPSGPLFHVTGTAAITGFNIPIGYNGGPICVIPDGNFTTTNANNIALATTAVTSKTLCWSYDGAAAKPFFPTY